MRLLMIKLKNSRSNKRRLCGFCRVLLAVGTDLVDTYINLYYGIIKIEWRPIFDTCQKSVVAYDGNK